MTICSRFAVVVVPFPFVDVDVAKPRPALVLSSGDFNRDHGQSILAMITTAGRSHWPSDVEIADLGSAGLHIRSYIRFKVFTLPNQAIARQAGRLGSTDTPRAEAALAAILTGRK